MAAGAVNANDKEDLVVLAYDVPDGANEFRYRVVWDLNSNGQPNGWSKWHRVPGVGNRGDGVGVDLADLNQNGSLDLVLMACDDPNGQNTFRYRVGLDIDAEGLTSNWSDWKQVTGVGKRAEGAGLAIADLNGNGRPEMVLMANDATAQFRYRIESWVECEQWRRGFGGAACATCEAMLSAHWSG